MHMDTEQMAEENIINTELNPATSFSTSVDYI